MQLTTPTSEEIQEYNKMSQSYPVYIDGVWYNPEDIDKPIPEVECGILETKDKLEERFKQTFYNQILYTLSYNWGIYENSNGFYAILKYTEPLKKAFHNALKLYGREDYEERALKALKYSNIDLNDKQNERTINIVLQPTLFDTYYEDLTMQYFHNDIEYWNQVLDNYKQKRAYNNRLKYLIDYMEKLKQLNISFLQEKIKVQEIAYEQRLKTNGTNNVTK